MSSGIYHFTTTKLQVRNSSYIMYSHTETNFRNSSQTNFTELLAESATKAYSGTVTEHSSKRIKKAVDLLLQYSKPVKLYNPIIQKNVKHTLSFITLTISQNDYYVCGKDAYNTALKPFLQWLTKTKGVNTYIWKAERQRHIDVKGQIKQSKGQLHYHITTPSFILWNEVKDKWNYIQRINGWLDVYHGKYGNYSPNSTDIHAVYKVKDIESYLVKYVSKEPERLEGETDIEFSLRTSVGGKVWDCSKNLKGKPYYTIEPTECNEMRLFQGLQRGELREIPCDYVGILKGKPRQQKKVLTGCQLLNYYAFIYHHKNNLQYEQSAKVPTQGIEEGRNRLDSTTKLGEGSAQRKAQNNKASQGVLLFA
jgi:hypothetical protein